MLSTLTTEIQLDLSDPALDPAVLIYGRTSQPTLGRFGDLEDESVLTESGPDRDLRHLYGPREQDPVCARSQLVEFPDHKTGEIHSYWRNFCWKNTCLACVRYKTRRLAKDIASITPNYLLTLTDLPGSWDESRPLLQEFRRLLVREHYQWRWVHFIEANPSLDGGAHLHALTTGDVPPVDVLVSASQRAGLGQVVHRQPVTHHSGLGYGWKTAAWNKDALLDSRRLNGSRLWHSSPGIWAA